MATGYLRYPHVHGDLITFVAGDDVWLSSIAGGRAWRLSADGAQVSYPRIARDGTSIAWTNWRDGSPDVYVADTAGGDATRLTFWADPQTRVTGWTAGGEVLAVTSAGQPAMKYRRAFAIPGHGDAPPRLLPFGPVNDLAIEDAGTALLTGSVAAEPAYWKRYRGGRAGKLWVARGDDPLFTRVLAGVAGQLASPMLVGSRLFFLSDYEGTGNIYSCALDGTGVRRHTDHDGRYARNPSTDGHRIVYHMAGEIWMLDGPDAPGPRKLPITLGAPADPAPVAPAPAAPVPTTPVPTTPAPVSPAPVSPARHRASSAYRSRTGMTTVTSSGPGKQAASDPSSAGWAIPVSRSRRASARAFGLSGTGVPDHQPAACRAPAVLSRSTRVG